MKRNHFGYNNIRNWKEKEDKRSYAIIPAPNAPIFQLLLTIPVAGLFYWLLHYKLDIADKGGLFMADCILIGTSILMVVIFLYNRQKTMKDMRPHLSFFESTGELLFPRYDRSYQLKDSHTFFIAHDFFDEGGEHSYSELNLVEPKKEGEDCFPLLHHLGYYKAYDRIGKKLEGRGVPFVVRKNNCRREPKDSFGGRPEAIPPEAD